VEELMLNDGVFVQRKRQSFSLKRMLFLNTFIISKLPSSA